MIFWFLGAAALLFSVCSLRRYFHLTSGTTSTLANQQRLVQWLHRCEEKLHCGFPLGETDFQTEILKVKSYSYLDGWIQSLRNAGQPLLPTLKGLRESVLFVNRMLLHSQAKVAPTRLQAKVSVGIVFVVSFALYKMLEGPGKSLGIWITATTVALVLAGYSFLWIEGLILNTIWKGTQEKTESQWFSYFLFPERLRGTIQMGMSLDEAWLQSVESLGDQNAFPLELRSLWSKGELEGNHSLEVKLLSELRAALQHALYHGTPVSERIQVWANQSRAHFESDLTARLETLPHRCLQPLYFCVAPAVVGLLVTGLVLEVSLYAGDFL